MRTRGLTEETAQIPVAFDPSLRPTEEIAKFTTELQNIIVILVLAIYRLLVWFHLVTR